MPLSVADRLAIRRLMARCNLAVDLNENESWLDCFTADAVYEFPPHIEVRGRDALRRMAERRSTDADRAPGRHWLGDLRIEGDGDRATVRCYMALVRAGDPPHISHTGAYRRELRREADGAWRFSRFTLLTDPGQREWERVIARAGAWSQ